MLFQLVGVLLSIIGIILTLVLSDPIKKKIKEKRIERKIKSEWDPDRHIEKGIIPVKDRYAWIEWSAEIMINERGDAIHEITAEVYNTSEELLTEIGIPLYCDEPNVHRDMLNIWAESDGRSVNTTLEEWDAENARGRMNIEFCPPVDPNRSEAIDFGYKLPRLLKQGEEYYNWDISVRHFEFSGEIQFDNSWEVAYARWDQNISSAEPIDWDDNSIRWDVQFPEVGERMKIIMQLDKS